MKKGLIIIPVSTGDEVLKHALVRPLVPIEWTEPEEVKPVAAAAGDSDHGVVTH